jgi:IS4 transposase
VVVVKELPQAFKPFVKHSAVTVLARAGMERILTPAWLDDLFEQTAETQYTKQLLFSTVFDLMSQTVCRIRGSIHEAYRASADDINASIVAVYEKLRRIEPKTSAAMVHECGREVGEVLDALGARRASWIEGHRIKLLDGNCLEASEHRIEELRGRSAGALPGKSLVVFDPALEAAIDVFPCEDGHAQERSLLGEVVATAEAGDVWIADRNFCTRSFLLDLSERGAAFIIRQHGQLPYREVGSVYDRGQAETGKVYEQRIEISDEAGRTLQLRRITLRLRRATRGGERELHIVTSLPVGVASAKKVCELYRKRWTIETVFQDLEHNLESEINTLGYPRAALFGFCVALVAYNILAIVHGALRSAHGEEKIDEEFSSYYLSSEISATARGMMIAIEQEQWEIFRGMSPAEFAKHCKELASHVKLAQFRKSRRGPKKPRAQRTTDSSETHVSTARLIAARRVSDI